MAKAKETPAGGEAPAKKGKLKKLIILVVVLLAAGVGGLYVYLEVLDAKAPPSGHDVQGKVAEPAHKEPGVMVPLEPFLVNLADTESRRYLKVKIEVEISNEKAVKEAEKLMPRFRDTIIMTLSGKTFHDLATPAGKEKLRQELLTNLRTFPGGQNIRGLFFTEFVSQ